MWVGRGCVGVVGRAREAKGSVAYAEGGVPVVEGFIHTGWAIWIGIHQFYGRYW